MLSARPIGSIRDRISSFFFPSAVQAHPAVHHA
jgi:hypothetical protein